ncbi:hypothetical protein F0562_000661 [Nyssa sinensis]|uniref:Small-subunit processome Utp12 domain-containing protein n=1 Tax=Nyssa sinensis TaxID=561372 RepID=A0A5J5C4Y9_9ASTE|nr:hypothetical protein F0562_000661 [Nyssa sinensis]
MLSFNFPPSIQLALLLLLGLSNAVEFNDQGGEVQCDYKPNLDPRPHSVSILEFGAVGDGKTLNTIAFQNAVFYLKSFADKGGAQLYVPRGRWLTGSFNLISHLTLFLASGAVILGSQDPSHWEIVEPLPSYGRGLELPGGRYQSLINGYKLHDVVITGDNGTIDGQGSVWWEWFSSHSLNYSRPHLLEFVASNNIVVSNLTFFNAPAYNIHPVYCSNVKIQNISVYAPSGSPYTVGIVPDSSDTVCIENSSISTGYDAIALKSGWDEYGIAYDRPTTSVHIKHVYLQASSGSALAFGSEMSGGISSVLVEHLHLYNSLSGIEFRTARGRGGYIKEIIISDVKMENVHTALSATGESGSHPDDKFDPNALPVLSEITLQNVIGENITVAGSFTVPNSQSLPPPQPLTTTASAAASARRAYLIIMGSSNIRDLLTAFSPSLDFLAISTGDGRIKIWDTSKGLVQIEFADIGSADGTDLFIKSERGHLSIDYTCMKWFSWDKKKKRKLGSSLLVLGTGSGDVLALDVSAGQLKWRVSDCHPGGVSAISFPTNGSCIYTAGADGTICELDSMTGNLLGKFKASTKAISSMSVSPDGKILATAAAQLKIFNSDHKKIQKFSGHPGAVRCMIFSEDGKYVLSSASGERYVAVWRIDGSKKQSACCVLAMDHSAVLLDSRCIDTGDLDDAGLSVLAISEMGICYFWYGKNIEELRYAKPTKVSLSIDDKFSKNQKGAVPSIFAAKLQGIVKPASAHMFVAYGLLIKPSFEKISVHSGTDIKLNSSPDGILLPIRQSHKSTKYSDVQNGVTALDRANAEDALLPMPKIFDFNDKKKRHQYSSIGPEEVTAENLVNGKGQAKPLANRDDVDKIGVDTNVISLEDRLRMLGILDDKDDPLSNSVLDSTTLKGISLEASMPPKKMKAAILSMGPSDAYKLLRVLMTMWQSRSCSGNYVLPWICCLLVNHSDYVTSQEPGTQMLDSLYKLTKSKGEAVQSLLQLSGRLQLVTAQIDKASQNRMVLMMTRFFGSRWLRAQLLLHGCAFSIPWCCKSGYVRFKLLRAIQEHFDMVLGFRDFFFCSF